MVTIYGIGEIINSIDFERHDNKLYRAFSKFSVSFFFFRFMPMLTFLVCFESFG